MNKQVKGRIIRLISISIMLSILSGCSFINVYNEIKKDPVVLDVEVYQIEDSVICKVILETDAYIDDTSFKVSQFKKIIEQEFKDSNITIIFIQNGIETAVY